MLHIIFVLLILAFNFVFKTKCYICKKNFPETKVSEKKRLTEKIKEKENQLRKKQEEQKRETEENVSIIAQQMKRIFFLPFLNVTLHLVCVVLA